jgi:hypothetical protein
VGRRRESESDENAGTAVRRLSEWHLAGFGVVPIALMLDPEARSVHVATYAALASCLDFATGRGAVYVCRIRERAGLGDRTARSALDWLIDRRYVKREKRRGHPSVYTLMPTDPDSLWIEGARSDAAPAGDAARDRQQMPLRAHDNRHELPPAQAGDAVGDRQEMPDSSELGSSELPPEGEAVAREPDVTLPPREPDPSVVAYNVRYNVRARSRRGRVTSDA